MRTSFANSLIVGEGLPFQISWTLIIIPCSVVNILSESSPDNVPYSDNISSNCFSVIFPLLSDWNVNISILAFSIISPISDFSLASFALPNNPLSPVKATIVIPARVTIKILQILIILLNPCILLFLLFYYVFIFYTIYFET